MKPTQLLFGCRFFLLLGAIGLAFVLGARALWLAMAMLAAGEVPDLSMIAHEQALVGFLVLAVAARFAQMGQEELPVAHVTIPKAVLARVHYQVARLKGSLELLVSMLAVGVLAGQAWVTGLTHVLVVEVARAELLERALAMLGLGCYALVVLLAAAIVPRMVLAAAEVLSLLAARPVVR